MALKPELKAVPINFEEKNISEIFTKQFEFNVVLFNRVILHLLNSGPAEANWPIG
jgi:hypothetical protein